MNDNSMEMDDPQNTFQPLPQASDRKPLPNPFEEKKMSSAATNASAMFKMKQMPNKIMKGDDNSEEFDAGSEVSRSIEMVPNVKGDQK